jgi:hypothetical protein
LIHLEGIHLPVSLGKVGRIVLHVALTRRSFLRANRIRAPHAGLAGPLAAERHVEDDGVVLEDGADVACPLELRLRHRPPVGVRSPCRDVGRDCAAGEVVDADRLASPVDGVHAATGAVEAVAVRVRAVGLDPASRVGALSWRVDGAVCRHHSSAEPAGAVDAAARIRVQSHRVEGVGVDSLDCVDFTAGRLSLAQNNLIKLTLGANCQDSRSRMPAMFHRRFPACVQDRGSSNRCYKSSWIPSEYWVDRQM